MKILNFLTILLMLNVSKCIIIDSIDQQAQSPQQQQLPERCESITIPMCMDIQYNQTILPNILGHINQDSAKDEIHQYLPLVKVNCSKHLQIFLCSIYVPVCNVLEQPLKPCKSLCIQARTGCDILMAQFGFRWPEYLDCEKFPESDKELCFGENNDSNDQHQNQNEYDDYYNNNNRINYYQNKFQSNLSIHHHHHQYHHFINHHQLQFKCPINFLVPSGMDYTFRIQGNEHKDCGMPCDDGLLFNINDKHKIRIWIGLWSILCIISTLFTIITFLFDTKRFDYPERAIIFLSICYLFIGVVYFIGFLMNDTIACNRPFPQPVGQPKNVQMIRTIIQGNKNEKCTLLFMLLYYFLLSNSIWWLILTVTWFFQASLKWGNEVIQQNYSHYFHLFSWTIPAILTIIILAMNKVEGDLLSGVCFISQWQPKYQFIFVIIPIFILLCIGFIFLSSGFISLLNIRKIIMKKHQNNHQEQNHQQLKKNLRKFDKFMFKIGFFSILYLIPSFTLIICLYLEQINIDSYLLQWLLDICSRFDYGIPCPSVNDNVQIQPKKPKLFLYLIKYFCFLMPGIISGVWIWSEKTVYTWNRIIKKYICCFFHNNNDNNDDKLNYHQQHQQQFHQQNEYHQQQFQQQQQQINQFDDYV